MYCAFLPMHHKMTCYQYNMISTCPYDKLTHTLSEYIHKLTNGLDWDAGQFWVGGAELNCLLKSFYGREKVLSLGYKE